MSKRICEELIIGNAILESETDTINIDNIIIFNSLVSIKLNNKGYNTFGISYDDIYEFCNDYSLFVTRIGDLISIRSYAKDFFYKIFREGLPIDVVESFKLKDKKVLTKKNTYL